MLTAFSDYLNQVIVGVSSKQTAHPLASSKRLDERHEVKMHYRGGLL